MSRPARVLGDVGGTNARFALAHVRAGAITVDEPKALPAKDYPKASDLFDQAVVEQKFSRLKTFRQIFFNGFFNNPWSCKAD